MQTDYKTVFPFEHYREFQERVIQKIIKAINEGKAVLVIAPTGFGKTGAGMTACRLSDSCFYTTPQILLQKQMVETPEFPDIAEIKGKGNYPCLESNSELSCANGLCKIRNNYECTYDAEGNCTYLRARNKAVGSKIIVTNFSYFLTVPKWLFRSDGDLNNKSQKDVRELLIVDEAHRIEDVVLNHIQAKVNLRKIPKELKVGIDFEREANLDNFRALKPYLEKFKEHYKGRADKVGQKIALIPDSELGTPESQILISRSNRYVKALNRISYIFDEVYDSDAQHNWIVNYDKFDDKLVFQPVYVSKYMERTVWSTTSTRILMSGSVINPKQTLKDIGLGDVPCEIIRVPSTFPPANRPIYLDYVVNMKYNKDPKVMDRKRRKMANKVTEIIKKYPNDKVIVHCHSYANAEAMYNYVMSDRILLQDRDDRMQSYDDWQETKNVVFLSVNMTEGIDLVEDMCRCQILLKTPYKSTEDKRVKRRLRNGDQLWYRTSTFEAVLQAYGRAVRSETDHADFYILDRGFEGLRIQIERYIPSYFTEAIAEIPN